MSERVVLDDALLAAAFESFARYGFARTTMNDIATAAGMSRPAVYLRVRNKDELLRLVAGELLAMSVKKAEAAGGDTGASLAARLEGVLRAKLDLILELAARSEHAVELLAAHARVDADGSAAYTATIESLLAGPLAERVTPRGPPPRGAAPGAGPPPRGGGARRDPPPLGEGLRGRPARAGRPPRPAAP